MININKNNFIKEKILFLIVSFNFLFAVNMTAPNIPELKAIAWDGVIILTWDKVAEESLDLKTGYSDFEGYRLYKSIDGGQTWGQPIPLNGQIAGYQPIFQTDLTEIQDTTRCVYSNSYYSNSNQCEERDVEISGPDPMAPWFNLGNNAFLEHSYYDYDVINGVQYTYAITAYDMGVRIGNTEYINCTYIDPEDNEPYSEFECLALINQNTEDPYCQWDALAENPCDWINIPDGGGAIIDTSWKRTGNPGKFTCPDGWMCPSFESPKLSESFTDYNANGIRDIIEEYIDSNGNGQYDVAESFTDLNGNGIWDSIDEPFIDCDFVDCIDYEGELVCEYDDEWGSAWLDGQEQSIWACEGDDIWNDLAGNNTWDPLRANAINVVTITPSVNAIDITFPDDETINQFFIADTTNVGTGLPGRDIDLKLVDESDLDPYIIKMEIQAQGDEDDFEGFKSRDPFLYVWRVDSLSSQNLVPGYYASYNVADISLEEISVYLDMPGATYSEDFTSIYIPTYEIDPHPIMFSDELGAEANYTQWFSGIQVRFDNYWFELPQTNSFAGISNIDYKREDGYDYIEGNTDEDGSVEIIDQEQFLPWILGEFDVPGQWWTNSRGEITLSYWGGSFESRPMFDYRIDFGATAYPDSAYRVFPSSSEDFCIDVSLNNESWDGNKDEVSFLPMKVTNLATGRQVRSWHNDKGIYTAYGSPSSDDPGYGDCTWNPNETLSFTHDSLAFSGNLDNIDDEKSFELVINYTLDALTLKYAPMDSQGSIDDDFEGFENWSSNINQEYPITTIVQYAETLWQATERVNESTIYPGTCEGHCPPSFVYDIDGDNVNDNPWKQLYPWEDGDYIIITPEKWYQDGDSWVADLSLLGKEDSSLLTQDALNNIYVTPNPFKVESVYNDGEVMFNLLPKQCKISIYTITGELIKIINHGSEIEQDGFHMWDLKNENGNTIVPGLYIFVIEAGNGLEPRIGKFVVIK